MGLKNSEHIGRIAIDPTNSDIVYVAAYGPLWKSGGERGIYKTIDGGKTWKQVLNVSEHTGFNEVMIDPRNPNIIYAVAHQRQRPRAAPADEQAVVVPERGHARPPQRQVACHHRENRPKENNFERRQVMKLLDAGVHAGKKQGAPQHLPDAGREGKGHCGKGEGR